MTAFPVILGISSSIVFLILLAKLMQRNRVFSNTSAENSLEGAVSDSAWSEEWFEQFSSFRYLPMRRLLSAEEEEFWMRSTDGSPARRDEFRSDRRRLFREYLRLISSDFGRLSQGVRLEVVHAAEDRSAEVSQLLSLEWSLRKLLWKAVCALTVSWARVKPSVSTRVMQSLPGVEFPLRGINLSDASA